MNEPPSEFAPPAEDAENGAPVPTSEQLDRLRPGGKLPEIGTLFSETMEEFTQNIAPYALAGLGQLVAIMPLVIVMVFAIYILMFAGMGVMMVGLFAAVSVVPQDLAPFVAIVVELVMGGGFFIVLLLFGAGMGAVMAPINASLVRAVRRHQLGEKELEFSSAFSTLGQDVFKVVETSLIVSFFTSLGVMMCYLPALLVALFMGWTNNLVALHRCNPVEAVQLNIRHVLDNLQWHVVFTAVAVGIYLLASYVPVIGPMFAVAFQVRAYREIFGDGEEPVREIVEA